MANAGWACVYLHDCHTTCSLVPYLPTEGCAMHRQAIMDNGDPIGKLRCIECREHGAKY